MDCDVKYTVKVFHIAYGLTAMCIYYICKNQNRGFNRIIMIVDLWQIFSILVHGK